MERHDFQIPVTFTHRIIFTRDAFSPNNPALADILHEARGRRAIVFLETSVAKSWKNLGSEIKAYFSPLEMNFQGVRLFTGGETCKADDSLVREIWREIDLSHIDRHSCAIAIGGGAFLDAVGFAVGTAHRGVRLIRFPTTTLAQDDSGVGVKNAINAFNKKNWIGQFAVPFAVINDFRFLESQPREIAVAGLIEAVKVALVKDAEFFRWIENNTSALLARQAPAFEECIKKSALLHARHIATSGDPFENGSSRPLDFGHWAAHKLEALTDYRLSHAEAVAIGLALDTVYAEKIGLLPPETSARILAVLKALEMPTSHPALDLRDKSGSRSILKGLDEFREHLGGELTVLLLKDIGIGTDVHHFDIPVLEDAIETLRGK